MPIIYLNSRVEPTQGELLKPLNGRARSKMLNLARFFD